jgi:hypothetical protein
MDVGPEPVPEAGRLKLSIGDTVGIVFAGEARAGGAGGAGYFEGDGPGEDDAEQGGQEPGAYERKTVLPEAEQARGG